MVLLVMVGVVFILVKPNYPPQKCFFSETGVMLVLVNLSVSTNHPPRIHHLVGVIWIIIMVILHLMLQLVTVKVVWVLGPLTFTPIKMIVSLVVAILCRLGLGIIQKQFI